MSLWVQKNEGETMGCDIHAYVDYDEPNDHDQEYEYDKTQKMLAEYDLPKEGVGQTGRRIRHLGSFHVGRDYLLFGIMAGVVRVPHYALFEPKGLPEHLSWQTSWDVPESVRVPHYALFEPKGLPEHLSWQTLNEATLFVVEGDFHAEREESGTCSKESAEQYHQSWLRNQPIHKQGVGGYVDADQERVYHPDWHSHSWLTTNELKQVIEKYASYRKLEYKTTERVNGEWVIPEGYKPDPVFASFFENKSEAKDYQIMPLVSIEPIALRVPATILAIYGAMKSLEESGCTPRFVFWFDN